MPVQSPDAFGFMVDFGAVGSVLGAGAGAAIGRPDRVTVAFVGDGGLFMTLGELDLLVRDQVPLLLVCMNDQAYGSELVHLQDAGLPPTEALFDTPDLARIAAAVGATAERVATVDALRGAVRCWLERGRRGPLVLDVPISRAVRSPLYSHI
jgi:thiamine pyrophosphate-dependent acetolactate synthase large subunit-like protein